MYIFIALFECVLIKECIIKEAGIIFDTKKNKNDEVLLGILF